MNKIEIAEDTLHIIETKQLNGIDISNSIKYSIEQTQAWTPDEHLPNELKHYPIYPSVLEVTNESSLQAAQRLKEFIPTVLNFASATRPGGGWLGGANAQEESLVRSSTLYACLKDHEMYKYNALVKSHLYNDYMLYSPKVLVFKDDEGNLIEPYECHFITSPAPNAGMLDSLEHSQLEQVFRMRMRKVIALAVFNQTSHFILGAWGCGVFGNSPHQVATLFKQELKSVEGAFEQIIFAVLDKRMVEVFTDILLN